METSSWIFGAFAAAVLWIVVKAVRTNRYWVENGIPQRAPWLFFGNMLPVLFKQKHIGQLIADICKEHPKDKVVGFYFFMRPVLLINDIDLVENVLIKDFGHFVDRSPQTASPEDDPLQLNLFSTGGNLWRSLRSKFSPMFTTSKLRFMFPQINDVSDDLIGILDKNSKNVDLADYFKKYGLDSMAKTAFGIDGRSLLAENSEFYRKAAELFLPTLPNLLRFSVGGDLLQKLGLPILPRSVADYFGNAVKDALNLRKSTRVVRGDFIQHMVTLQEKGYVEVEKNDVSDKILEIDIIPDEKVELTDELMAGQSLGFLLAGFDAVGSTLGWLCYELSRNPDVQRKARQEVIDVIKRNGGKLDYDVAKEMKYLSYCMKESNRMHTLVSKLDRYCTKPYRLPGTSYTVPLGHYIYVPSLSIHYNPQFFPQPDKFLPERWSPEHNRPSCSYLAWGAGPRMCIGMRFAGMEMMCALAKVLSTFEIKLDSSYEVPARIDSYAFFMVPSKPFKFNLQKLQEKIQ